MVRGLPAPERWGRWTRQIDARAIARETGGQDGVLVAAPTGSGKTLVGEFAVHLALASGRKCFYTTPIKALSNQKYYDLVKRYGADNVGLLTGDNVVNGEAPVVVMTTEVLRNMLYADSPAIDGLGDPPADIESPAQLPEIIGVATKREFVDGDRIR